MDTPSGYHQVCVEKNNQQKLVFAGHNGTKYTYLVMSFGPVNRPVIFIVFIHNVDVIQGIVTDECTTTKFIVDDISVALVIT